MHFAKNIQFLTRHHELLGDAQKLSEMSVALSEGDIFIAKQVVDKTLLVELRHYLTQIGKNSLPNYQKIEAGAPNFHRINYLDERAYVKASFHQFSFFPWNQDVFGLFDIVKDIYAVRNLLAGLAANKFLSRTPEADCTARLSFQFYPRGTSGMNTHVDPYDFHQVVVPILMLSKKGEDFQEGGAYVERADGSKIIFDDHADIGDVIYFHASLPHGVLPVDPDVKQNWLAFQGRWVMLAAVNRLATNQTISNSVEMGKK